MLVKSWLSIGCGIIRRSSGWGRNRFVIYVVLRHLVYVKLVKLLVCQNNKETYRILNNLFSFILPIFSVDISCCNFCRLLLRSTPRVFDVRELVVRMEYWEYNQNYFIYIKLIWLTESQHKTWLFIEPRIILSKLFKPVCQSIFVQGISRCVAFLLCRLKLFQSRESSPKGWLVFWWKGLLDSIRILLYPLSLVYPDYKQTHIPSKSRASVTLSQSWSDSLNADHGMCLRRRLSWCNVVIGPYISSADDKKRAIGWRRRFAWSSILKAVPHWMLLCNGIFTASEKPQRSCALWKYSTRCPDACI